MSLRVLTVNDAQIVSGTEIMNPGEGGDHTRILAASLPRFASRPDITVSIYSSENMPNAGTTFAPWSIEYVPAPDAGGLDLIVVAAANTTEAQSSNVQVVCSFIAIGERAQTNAAAPD